MYPNQSVFLFLIVSAVVTHGAEFQYDEIQLAGSCPKVRFITNFEMPRIIGWYYRAFSNLNNTLCFNNDAQTMFAAAIDATTINVDFCCRSAANPTITICGDDIGSGRIAGLARAGEFTYETKGNIYPNFILDTNYDDFTIVYGCKPRSGSNQRDEKIFVYTRGYTLTATLLPRVRRVLERNGIQWSAVRPVRQGATLPYLPLPKQCN